MKIEDAKKELSRAIKGLKEENDKTKNRLQKLETQARRYNKDNRKK